MKTIYKIALFLLIPFIGFTQSYEPKNIDSLKNTLNSIQIVDTAKAEVYLELAFLYRNISVDSALFFGEKALRYSQEIHYLAGEIQALRNIGLAYLRAGNHDTTLLIVKKAAEIALSSDHISKLGDIYNTLGSTYYNLLKYDSAKYYYLESAKIFEEQGRYVDVAGANLNIGAINENMGNEVDALKKFQESLLVFEALNHQQGIAAASYNLSDIFANQGDFQKAIFYLSRTARIDSLTNNYLGYAESSGMLASFYEELGRVDTAISYYQRSIQLATSKGFSCYTINSLKNLGELYMTNSLLDSASYYLKKASNLANSCENPKGIIATSISLSKLYAKTNQTNKSIKLLQTIYGIAIDNGLKNDVMEIAELLYLNYKSLNDDKLALKYLETYDSLRSLLFNAAETRKIAQLEAEYTLEKERQKYAYNQGLRENNYQKTLATKQRESIFYSIIALVSVIIILIIWRLYYQKSEFTKLLEKQNIQIKKQQIQLEGWATELEQKSKALSKTNEHLQQVNKEKNTIIGIVAHDLKSPLNQIRGLIEISKLENYDDQTIKANLDTIDSAATRSVEFIDRILDISAAENRLITIKKSEILLNELIISIEEVFKTDAIEKDIKLIYSGLEDPIIETDPILLREIIENLVSNAIKYAPRNTQVTVSVEKLEKHYSINIIDEGPGFSATDEEHMYDQYQTLSAHPTANEKATGLGLSIVRRNINALNYQLQMNSSEKGTQFKIKIPF